MFTYIVHYEQYGKTRTFEVWAASEHDAMRKIRTMYPDVQVTRAHKRIAY